MPAGERKAGAAVTPGLRECTGATAEEAAVREPSGRHGDRQARVAPRQAIRPAAAGVARRGVRLAAEAAGSLVSSVQRLASIDGAYFNKVKNELIVNTNWE